jgi:hypothetical protein
MSATPNSEYKPVKPYFDLVRSALGDSVDGEHFFDCSRKTSSMKSVTMFQDGRGS